MKVAHNFNNLYKNDKLNRNFVKTKKKINNDAIIADLLGIYHVLVRKSGNPRVHVSNVFPWNTLSKIEPVESITDGALGLICSNSVG